MASDQFISKRLHALFARHGLKVVEQASNVIKYESTWLHILLIFNPRESSSSLWVGRIHSDAVEIDDYIMQEYFNSDIKLSMLPEKVFVNNVLLFFAGKGKGLLEGNASILDNLEKINSQRSLDYTTGLIENQNLQAANKAWAEGNYVDVIRYLDKIHKDNLPPSYKQKYKIAKQKSGI